MSRPAPDRLWAGAANPDDQWIGAEDRRDWALVEYVRADIAAARVHVVEHQALELGRDLVNERKAVEADRDRYRTALRTITELIGSPHARTIAERALAPATTDAQEGTP